mgnify:CR=1 FL=1
MSDMENDPDVEPTGGSVADMYGDQLNMIDSDVYEFMEQEAVQAQIDSEVFNLAAIAEDGEEVDDAVDYM